MEEDFASLMSQIRGKKLAVMELCQTMHFYHNMKSFQELGKSPLLSPDLSTL